jgi:hypothetical protein
MTDEPEKTIDLTAVLKAAGVIAVFIAAHFGYHLVF